MGARSNSVPRRAGSATGLAALNAARKTSPDTVFVPRAPTSVTLIRRPETPRCDRSSSLSAPTFVRESAASIALRAAAEYVAVCHLAYGEALSYEVPSGARSLDPRR